MIQDYLRPPAELRAAPSSVLQGVAKRSRARPLPPRQKVAKPAPKQGQLMESYDTAREAPTRVGRCRVLRADGQRMVIPPRPERWGLVDAENELLIVELSSPDPWLEDETVTLVRVLAGQRVGCMSRVALRSHVMSQVPLSPVVKSLERAVYKICLAEPGLRLTAVPVAAIMALVDFSPDAS